MWIQWIFMRRLCTTPLEPTWWTWSSCWWNLEPTCSPVTISERSHWTTRRRPLPLMPASSFMKVISDEFCQKHQLAQLATVYWKTKKRINRNVVFLTGNPLNLQQLCRIVLRRMLGTKASDVMDQLNVSRRIYDYLQFSDHCWISTIHWKSLKKCLIQR